MEIVNFNLRLFHVLKNVSKGYKEGIQLTYNLGQQSISTAKEQLIYGIHQFLEYRLYQKEDGPKGDTGLREKSDSKNKRQTRALELVPVIFR